MLSVYVMFVIVMAVVSVTILVLLHQLSMIPPDLGLTPNRRPEWKEPDESSTPN